jgi:hypothetical protein
MSRLSITNTVINNARRGFQTPHGENIKNGNLKVSSTIDINIEMNHVAEDFSPPDVET